MDEPVYEVSISMTTDEDPYSWYLERGHSVMVGSGSAKSEAAAIKQAQRRADEDRRIRRYGRKTVFV